METRVLYIGAHNDECDFDAGGVAHLLHVKGCRQRFINPACLWHDRNLDDATKQKWMAQEQAAAAELGADMIVIGSRDCRIFQPSADIIEQLEREILNFMPDIVFIHWPRDNHIEHRAVADVSHKALCIAHVHGAKIKEVYAFEAGICQSTNYFNPDFAVNVEDSIAAVEKSMSHFDQNTAHAAGLIYNYKIRASYRGCESGFKYAEAYKIVKFPNGSDDFILKKLLGDKFRWNGNGMYPAGGEAFF